METLEQTKDALSHSHPGASTEEILMACMQLMLANKAKQRGLVEKPLETSHPDHIPAHVRRAVMERSGGRCEWVLDNGERCNSSYQVECDLKHATPCEPTASRPSRAPHAGRTTQHHGRSRSQETRRAALCRAARRFFHWWTRPGSNR
jgi:hypothetical protein